MHGGGRIGFLLPARQERTALDLEQYDRFKFELAETLRAGTMHVRQIGGDSAAVRDIYARLAEDRFNLVVVGRFSRGKTSLMNAMLGTNRLPTGIVPVTSVITTVAYGTDEKVVLYYYNSNLFMDIRLDQLPDYITERGNPGNVKAIRTAEVQLPAEILRRGFHFIDTPGLGSSIIENTRTTEAFLPEADAFVLVTSYDSPLSEEEQRVLRIIHESGRRVFLVVNKQDAANQAERQEALLHLQQQLAQLFADVPPLFSLSARQGLASRMAGDSVSLRESGLPALEAALIDFLVNDKRTEFLLNLCTRIGEVLRAIPQAGEQVRRVEALRAEVLATHGVHPAPDRPSEQASVVAATLPACEICAHVTQTVFDFICQYQYQLHGIQSVQADLARRHGLCGPHTWQFEAVAATREICTGFAQVLQRYASDLRAAAGRGDVSPTANLAMALPNAETCPICDIAKRAESAAIGSTVQRLRSDPTNALANLSAICLPHLVPLLGALGSSPLTQHVMRRQADLLDRLSEDMRRFALKQDAVRRYLLSKEEVGAAQRALRVLAGHPNAQIGPEAGVRAPRLPTALHRG